LPFKVSQEVHDLYCWRNGTDPNIVQRLFLDYAFMPLEEAITCAEYINEDFKENRQLEGDPTYLFPIFDIEGNYLVVAASSTATTTFQIYSFGSDCGDIDLEFNSLTAMLLTIAEAYESGVYTVNSEGDVECSNTELFGEIAGKYNVDPTGRLLY
jgi:hypothetical protein